MRKRRYFPFYVGNSGCDYHRVRLPFMYGWDYIDNQAYEGFEIERLLDYLDKTELIVWNRFCPIDINHIIHFREKNGMKVVVDLDDWVELPWFHPSYRFYKDGGAKMIIDGLKAADAVTVTTARLADKVRQFNSNVHVIPNAIPFGEGRFTPSGSAKPNYFNLVYAGQSSHLEDVRILINPFKRVRTIPGIGITMAGYTDNRIFHKMEEVFKILPNYSRINNLPLDEYMALYDMAHCSIVPLLENSFNAHKSNLKILEAASKKLPVIVSKVAPYSDDPDAPVFWVERQSDWYKHIHFLSRNRKAAAEKGEELFEWAREKYDLLKWNKVRFQIYENLLFS
jgi:glycosyltransferase involved in cell wall biosynthesis